MKRRDTDVTQQEENVQLSELNLHLLELVARLRTELRRMVRRAGVGYLILLAFVAGSLYVLEQRADEKLRGALVNSCDRVNTLRGQVNNLTEVAHSAWTRGIEREDRLARIGPPVEREAHRRAAKQLRVTRDRLRVTEMTDCGAAVDEADRYPAPKPHPIPVK